MVRIRVIAVLLATALSLGGCGGESTPPSHGTSMGRDTVVIEGVLASNGGRCATLRSDVGELYALENVPAPYREWERFVDERFLVVGEESTSGRCVPGRALRVIEMGLVLSPGLRIAWLGGDREGAGSRGSS
jgi:hypothetical protein